VIEYLNKKQAPVNNLTFLLNGRTYTQFWPALIFGGREINFNPQRSLDEAIKIVMNLFPGRKSLCTFIELNTLLGMETYLIWWQLIDQMSRD
jgi:hypothetical protein